MKLPARQKKFVEYYAECGNVVQSALKAGYSKTYANKRMHAMLDNVGVASYLASITEKAQKGRILSALDRQEALSDIVKSEDEFTADKIRAIDTLNKMTGEYINKVEVAGQIAVEDNRKALQDFAENLFRGDGDEDT